MVKLQEARSEREEAYSSQPGFNNLKKSNKKQVKFVSLLDVLFICLFQLYLNLVIEAFRITTNLQPL